MIANYHSHTIACHHATGTVEGYVQSAIERKLKIFGFSDHAPQWFPGDYYSKMRMFPDQLQDYCDKVREMQIKYSRQLEIPLGLEAEYYPALFPTLLQKARDAGVQYLLLGQHWCGNEEGEPYNGRPTEDVALLTRYCDQVIDALHTGLFSYLAHPDLFHFVGDHKAYREQMRRICLAAKQTDTPLEINLLGIRVGRHYPNKSFWELAAEENCRVVFGIDAHSPEEVLDTTAEVTAMEIVKKYDLKVLETISLRNI